MSGNGSQAEVARDRRTGERVTTGPDERGSKPTQKGEDLVVVEHLKKFYPIRKGVVPRVVGHVKAVHDVSFRIGRGETFGLVGESGCGKTTVGRSILRLIEPTDGRVLFDRIDVVGLRRDELRRLRRRMQIIFQDPYSSLNPRYTVSEIVGEAMRLHGVAASRSEAKKRVGDLLERVGLSRNYINRYPHEFSGGQRQRIGIARALAVNPEFIVCDEAVSALDVSIQAQILNLLNDLQRELNLSYLFIAHDLAVVRHISDRIGVMYLGEIVEEAETEDLYRHPMHPYTRALLSAIPVPVPKRVRKHIPLAGDVPSPINPPSGCHFRTRCPLATEVCAGERPPLVEIRPRHWSACYHMDRIDELPLPLASEVGAETPPHPAP
jgi:oligopeptide/dipeptide ABC transporter ATP-binding protein